LVSYESGEPISYYKPFLPFGRRFQCIFVDCFYIGREPSRVQGQICHTQ